MAEIALIKKVTGEFPILLLDDVMSELDNHRQLKLLESIDEEVQTFMTTTSLDHLSNLPPDLKTFLVKNGNIYGKTSRLNDLFFFFLVIDRCDKYHPISCKSFQRKSFINNYTHVNTL